MIPQSKSDEQILQVLNSAELISNFWKRVNKTKSCWLWIGDISHNGYGRFCPKAGMTLRAHRVSFTLHNGHLPIGIIMHSCDNRACVNPEHLRDGTQKENVDDMHNKGRGRKKLELDSCIRGHPFVEGSFWVNGQGYKICKKCHFNE